MLGSPDTTFSAEDLLRGWSPRRIGRRLVLLADCASTNDTAFEAAADARCDGLVVMSDHQSAGRGRQGRAWASPRGAGILCSVVLETGAGDEPPQAAHSETAAGGRLTLAGAVAACEAIREATDVTPSIKWPNDLRVNGRKLAGILIESRHIASRGVRLWVMGIGINCLQQAAHFPPELRGKSTSLELESQGPVDRARVARTLLQRLDDWLGPGGPDSGRLHEAWLHFAEPLGGSVRLRSEGRDWSGRIVSIDPAGGLIVQLDEGGPDWFDPLRTSVL